MGRALFTWKPSVAQADERQRWGFSFLSSPGRRSTVVLEQGLRPRQSALKSRELEDWLEITDDEDGPSIVELGSLEPWRVLQAQEQYVDSEIAGCQQKVKEERRMKEESTDDS